MRAKRAKITVIPRPMRSDQSPLAGAYGAQNEDNLAALHTALESPAAKLPAYRHPTDAEPRLGIKRPMMRGARLTAFGKVADRQQCEISRAETGDSIWLRLPYPPQLNNSKIPTLVGGRPRMVLSPKARDYKKATEHLKLGVKPLRGEVSVVIYAYRPRKVGDIDGILKLALDALTGAAYEDDRQIVKLTVHRRDDKANPRLVAIVDRIEPVLTEGGHTGKQTEGARREG